MLKRSSMQRVVSLSACTAAMALVLLATWSSSSEQTVAQEDGPVFPDHFAQIGEDYTALRAQYQDLTFPELRDRLGPEPEFQEALPFDPTRARYFDLVDYRLQITDEERELFSRNGFVSIDQSRGLSFPAAYQQVYTSDLPVFITSDSILHALHRSYDDILKELEVTCFQWTIDRILTDSQAALAERVATSPRALSDNLRDADLYLGVARKLLHTTPPESVRAQFPGTRLLPGRPDANEDPVRILYSVLGQDAAIDAVIADIDSLRLQSPESGDTTAIYGGERFVDYSQFKPRGHYTESAELAAYFRCLMWLGRADCGWNVLPVSGLIADTRRELRNAVLLSELLQESAGDTRLQELDRVLEFLVGRSDNFDVFQLSELSQSLQITSVDELLDDDVARRLEDAIARGVYGEQLIRSQTLSATGGSEPTQPPVMFQLFGQRFVIGSFVLSRVVHDEILYQGQKVLRHRPTGLDVMAALGNDEATHLLADELERWQYSANLLACREVVEQLDPGFWNESLHHVWVDSLRSLDADLTVEPHAPAALQTRAWQRKQLQTQLASWAELRRDNILYAKQSFGVPGCAFPCGYVEPYPEFYAKLRWFADTAGPLLGGLSPDSVDEEHHGALVQILDRLVAFFTGMSVTMEMLEQIARDELRGQPHSDAQRDFLRGTFDDTRDLKFGSARLPDFSGWYCGLYYARHRDPTGWKPLESKPVVADVHTNPHNVEALEVATGDARLMLIAIEGPSQPTVYVGPVYSYYEFWQPAEQRLTDHEWRRSLATGNAPPRPEWVDQYEAQSFYREPENPRVTVTRRDQILHLSIARVSGGSSGNSMPVSTPAVRHLARHHNLHSLDLSNSEIDDAAIEHLSGLPDLRSLDLSATQVTDAGVAFLREHAHLQSLDLSATSIGDAALPSLVNLTYLSRLNLSETRVTEAAVRELREQLPDTEVLY